MEYIYIIAKNGEPYLTTFNNYKSAVKAVKEKHKEYLQEQIKELYDLVSIESVLANVNVPENTNENITQLYIEKGINIRIYKLPIKIYRKSYSDEINI
jgi:hypothetical protein